MFESFIRQHIENAKRYGGERLGYLKRSEIQDIEDYMERNGVEGYEVILYSGDFQHYLVRKK